MLDLQRGDPVEVHQSGKGSIDKGFIAKLPPCARGNIPGSPYYGVKSFRSPMGVKPVERVRGDLRPLQENELTDAEQSYKRDYLGET